MRGRKKEMEIKVPTEHVLRVELQREIFVVGSPGYLEKKRES